MDKERNENQFENSKTKILYQSGDKGQYTVHEESRYNDKYITYRMKENYIYSCTYISDPLREQIGLSYLIPIYMEKERIKKILILGAGSGANIRQLHEINSDFIIDAVDIDPEAFFVARNFFHIENNKTNLIIEDAAKYVKNTNNEYDAIIIDVFRNDCIPSNCISFDFYRGINNILTAEGICIVNTNITERFCVDINEINYIQQIHNIISSSLNGSLFINDFNNMGILYLYRKGTVYDLKQKLVSQIKKTNNIHLKVSLMAALLSIQECHSIINNAESNVSNYSKSHHLTTKILSLMRKSPNVDNEKQLFYIWEKYFRDKFSARMDEIIPSTRFNIINIDNINYYYEVINYYKNKKEIVLSDFSRNIAISNYPLNIKKNMEFNEIQSIVYNYIIGIDFLRSDNSSKAFNYLKNCIQFFYGDLFNDNR